MNTQKISNYELENNRSDYETVDSKTVKKQVNTQTASVTHEKKKEKGWFSFINEKLNEWPLWVMLTQDKQQIDKNYKEENKQKVEKKLAKMALTILPWNEYFQRGPLRPYYCYLHNKQDKMTYFYAMKRVNIELCSPIEIREISKCKRFLIVNICFGEQNLLSQPNWLFSSSERIYNAEQIDLFRFFFLTHVIKDFISSYQNLSFNYHFYLPSLMQNQQTHQLKSKQNASQNGDLETLDSRSQTGSIDTSEVVQDQVPSKSKQKEDKGWLSFINEKLNEWPLWLKLTSSGQGKDSSVMAVKNDKKVEETKKPRTIKCRMLPWQQFMDRGIVRPLYHYCHIEQENLTYFYQVTRKSKEEKHEQDAEIPSEYLVSSRFMFTMPMDQAKTLLKAWRQKKNHW